ncbi:MAG TPA: S8 family peptidase [Pyrinomonadaceae bacterium]|nr:S8 family peptidase [Pyrinomonadaceae bacterium]
MRKTLALLLAGAVLYFVPSPPRSTKSQTLTTSSKFYTVDNPIPNRYIVVLATTDLSPIPEPTPTSTTKTATPIGTSANTPADSSMASHSSTISFVAQPTPADPTVVTEAMDLTSDHGGSFSRTWSKALKGFRLHATEAQALSMSQDSRVAFIVQDGAIAVGTPDTDPIVMTPDPGAFLNPQPHASWGLDRLNQRYLPLDKSYSYNRDGEGVNAYIIDTGILTTHWEFGQRAFAVYDALEGEGNGIDCNGHGSHVAGTIGGQTYGVAKRVRLLSVRVLNCQGTGTWSDVIDGVNFVTWHRAQPEQQGAPAVANMSLGGERNMAVDAAVRNSIRAQVTYVVAAGNGSSDASNYSPAAVSEAITVGATDRIDARAEFSNYGPVLDLFAPGVSIPSAWIGSDLMIATASGTSMASPHVAGVAALYLQNNRTASPAAVRSALVGNSTSGVIRNPGQETPNRLLFSNY